MTDQEKAYRADEARRLLEDDLAQEVLRSMREEALEALARANVEDQTALIKLQIKVALIDDFTDNVEAFILDGDGEAHKIELP